MKKITLLLTVLTLAFSSVSGQTVFDWDTNAVHDVDNENVTETIDDITVTFSGGPDIGLLNGQGALGTSGYIVWHSTSITSVTFTFDQPVNVNSILPIDAYYGSMNYTFTPIGGTNSEVVASIVEGVATTGTVDLNWVGVTSFTVTASEPAAFGFDNLSVSPDTSPPTTVFDWDTNAVDKGDYVTETIDDITVTFSGGSDIRLLDGQETLGTSGYIVYHSTQISSVTFTFDQPVDVNSILPVDGFSGSMNYTFTPTGGTNLEVVASIVEGVATTGTVDLNWVGVTSFTVTASEPAAFGFDNLSVSPDTSLSVTDAYVSPKVLVYPNPVANMLYIKNIIDLKYINVYNNLGQLVLQSKEATIDVSQLSKGMYFLQIRTGQGIETKRIIKK